MSHKSQVSFIDLIVSFTIFTAIFLINFQVWNSIQVKIQNTEASHYFDTSVYETVDVLLETAGDPINWTDDITNAYSIGLAIKSNVLDYNKLMTLNNSDYNTIKDQILPTGDFELVISNKDEELFRIGSQPRGEITKVERIVKVNDDYYNFVFKGWQNE